MFIIYLSARLWCKKIEHSCTISNNDSLNSLRRCDGIFTFGTDV